MINIFVAKLDYSITSDQLKQEFEVFGQVNKATVATDRETGNPRGFAFVEMANREDGLKAIESLDDKSFNGRRVAVKEAEDRRGNKNKPKESNSSFKKPFTKEKTNSNNINRFDEDKKNPLDIPPQSSSEEFQSTDVRKKSKEKSKKEYNNDDSDLKTKKTKNSSFKKQNKYGKFSDFDDDDDDISLLSLRKELEREEFEDDEEDDDDLLEF